MQTKLPSNNKPKILIKELKTGVIYRTAGLRPAKIFEQYITKSGGIAICTEKSVFPRLIVREYNSTIDFKEKI